VGGPGLGALTGSETFAILAELGAILLLFEVGLESTPRDMLWSLRRDGSGLRSEVGFTPPSVAGG
jgi:Kef-type K+ transport system membrane component KefB